MTITPQSARIHLSENVRHWRVGKMDRRFWGSRAIIAFLAFVVMDIACRALYPCALLEKYEPRESTLLAELVKHWKAADPAPGICFMGSSLMQCALRNSTPTFLNQALTDGAGANSFSWALGGENASDAYAIVSSMMTSTKKPKLLIYGIAPRDLLDNNVKSPVSTDIFRYLSSLPLISLLPNESFVSLDDRVSCYLKQASFLVDRKNAITNYITDTFQSALPHMVPGLKDLKLARIEQQKKAEDTAMKNAPLPGASPDAVATTPSAMAKKVADYNLAQAVSRGVTLFRYNPYSRERYNRQLVFLDRMLSHLNDLGVQVVVIKMPLKKEHIAMMPVELTASFASDVQRLTTKYGAALLDYNTNDFRDENYADVAHLGPSGAKIFQAKLLENFRRFSVLTRRTFGNQVGYP